MPLSSLLSGLYKIILQEEDGWWKGNLHGKVGMFPSNYVEVVGAEEASKQGNTFLMFLFSMCVEEFNFSTDYLLAIPELYKHY